MKMIDMKHKKGEKCEDVGSSKYPYGLMLNLEDEQIQSLGIDLPEVGAEMMLNCKVKVVSCREEEDEGGETQSSCQLQIVAIGTKGKAKGLFDHPSRVKLEE